MLGVLIEKSLTTPDGYPLSLNALVSGCNQKSNRHPMTAFDETTVAAAVRDLRMNRLVQEFGSTGARVPKFGHRAGERLELEPVQLAVIAELLMRGPQTAGELRGRANRMAPIASMSELTPIVAGLVTRGFVAHVAPAEGSRAGRLMQRLAPGLHGEEQVTSAPPQAGSGQAPATPAHADPHSAAGHASGAGASGPATSQADTTDRALRDRVTALEAEVARLARRLDQLHGA
ncbi:MAG: hypothetical protein DHS20C15_30050 [Planctomycetota bacterium]|nr:MAG: hypothetical protein DHS20C15_30050 [Planctomycetota bacterium]